MAESKKHHFVPKSLLKDFCNDDNQLFVFDKILNKSFPSTVENAGHENYFNSLEVEGGKINFETFYEKIDAEQAILIRKINDFEEEWELTDTEKWKLAYFTLVQMHRTKLNRTSTVEFSNELQNWMDKLTQKTPYKPVNAKINNEESKIISLEHIKSIPEHIHHLTERFISIVRAPKDHTFYCSDNPVVMYNPYPYLKTGLGVVGTEICFPISKNHLITFSCSVTSKKIRAAYHDHLNRNCKIPKGIDRLYQGLFLRKILEIETHYVEFFNHLQVIKSSRFLYSAKNDFVTAQKILEVNPELKEVKATMGLGSRPMTDMPDGEHIVIFLKDKEHSILAIELLSDEYDLHFRVSREDNWKVAVLYNLKETIEFVQVFKDKKEGRGMRDVEIISYDHANRTAVISHRDKGFNEVLKLVRAEKAKRQKNNN